MLHVAACPVNAGPAVASPRAEHLRLRTTARSTSQAGKRDGPSAASDSRPAVQLLVAARTFHAGDGRGLPGGFDFNQFAVESTSDLAGLIIDGMDRPVGHVMTPCARFHGVGPNAMAAFSARFPRHAANVTPRRGRKRQSRDPLDRSRAHLAAPVPPRVSESPPRANRCLRFGYRLLARVDERPCQKDVDGRDHGEHAGRDCSHAPAVLIEPVR
jgi:hypothetical protein